MSAIIVAGGGLAGGAAACALAQAGREVVVLERDRAPAHRMCGEFLSIEAQASLAAIGLDVEALGGARIARLRLVRDAAAVGVALPFRGLGVTRRRLDAALLDHAASCGAIVRRGVAVRGVDARAGLRLDLADGSALRPEVLLLATGKHDLRGVRRRAAMPEALVGFKMYFRLRPAAQAALLDHIDLILFADGYAGLQLVEDGMANLSLLVDRARVQRTGGTWAGLLADLLARNAVLADRLEGAVPLLDQPLSIFRVPYGFVHRPGPDDPAGVFRLGDQAGVIPSFTGDGMAIALHSAARATAAVLGGGTAFAYHAALRRDIRGQIMRAAALYRVARGAPTQRLLFEAAGVFPGLLRLAARYTRVPQLARSLPS
ncbi:NAD(P)/FAD-dependent oxidoreductase [Acidiphilium sp.]|uniref:NAD(P)/FAD-dependent oxidoreductase n=1 Tax=Acidiphilium sp. TaxID=527 RepID=UPI003D051007